MTRWQNYTLQFLLVCCVRNSCDVHPSGVVEKPMVFVCMRPGRPRADRRGPRGVVPAEACEWQHGEAVYIVSVDSKAAFDALIPERVLQAMWAFGVSARTQRAFAEVLFFNKATARMAVETDEFPYLPTRQGGVEESTLL